MREKGVSGDPVTGRLRATLAETGSVTELNFPSAVLNLVSRPLGLEACFPPGLCRPSVVMHVLEGNRKGRRQLSQESGGRGREVRNRPPLPTAGTTGWTGDSGSHVCTEKRWLRQERAPYFSFLFGTWWTASRTVWHVNYDKRRNQH